MTEPIIPKEEIIKALTSHIETLRARKSELEVENEQLRVKVRMLRQRREQLQSEIGVQRAMARDLRREGGG